MSGVTTVIFDFDGTLANSVDLMFDLYNSHTDQFGYLPVEREEFPVLRRLGYAKTMRLKKIKARRLPKIVAVLSKEMRKSMDRVKPYEGIIDTLKDLQKNGFSIGVLTSNQSALVEDFFKKHNFPNFDFVVSEKTIFGKDKALKKIIRRFEIEKDKVVYVGDEPRDVTASHKAGIRAIGVSWGLAGTEGFELITPDALVHTPSELKQTIKLMSSPQ
jgi:phosphoglycolate phosphatase